MFHLVLCLLLQAFVVAQDLGIACTLTPNAMLLNSVPDKLAVTSFVYQMYNYFTKATISAVSKKANPPTAVASARESSSTAGNFVSSSSPIDSVSQFNEKFTFDRMSSPVSPDAPLEKKTLPKYSRYCVSESQPAEAVNQQQQADDSPKHSPEIATGKESDELQMSSANQSASSTLIGNLANGESEGGNQSPLPSSPVFSHQESLPNGLQIGSIDEAGIVAGGKSEIKDNAASLEEERKPQQTAESPQSSNESIELYGEKASSPNDSSHHADSPVNTQNSNLPTERSESPRHTEQTASAGVHHSRHSFPDVTSRRTMAASDGPDTSSSQSMEKGQNVSTC